MTHVLVFVPEVSLSSDFISGFCGETEDDHLQTLSLIREVGYNVGFLFAYSMRKVSAHGYITICLKLKMLTYIWSCG